jgi:hypothetical protein
VSVSEPGLTSLPTPGIYRDGENRYEVRNSNRGRWYAVRIEPDGSTTYVAQNVDLTACVRQTPGLLLRQQNTCSQPTCTMPVWFRGLCGMHHAADAARRAKGMQTLSRTA